MEKRTGEHEQAQGSETTKTTQSSEPQSKNQSPLAMMILALLEEHPMHVYGMHKLMLERGQDRLVNIERRNSIQQVLSRLHRDGCVETVDGDTGRRIIYSITDLGRSLLYDWLRAEISRPKTEYPRFTAAVSLLGLIRPSNAATLLAARRQRLIDDAAHLRCELTQGESLPAVLTLEVDLRLTTTQAEIEWLDRVIAGLESKDLSWERDDLLALSTAHDQADD